MFCVAAGALLLALTGCQVSTRVSVDETSAGHGTVQVAVSLDQSTVAALGGASALSSDLDLAGLASSGWQVKGPSPSPPTAAPGPGSGSGSGSGSGEVITATHAFSSDAQAAQLLSSLAGSGSGPAASRPFQFQLTQRSTFWHTYSGVTGRVDLTCGIDCFGDAGLKAATGQETGVDPTPLLGRNNPAQVFPFSLQVSLPSGSAPTHTNAASRSSSGGREVLTWTPQLGKSVAVSAETETLRTGSVALVASLAGVGLLVVLGVGGWLVWRRRRRRAPLLHARRSAG